MYGIWVKETSAMLQLRFNGILMEYPTVDYLCHKASIHCINLQKCFLEGADVHQILYYTTTSFTSDTVPVLALFPAYISQPSVSINTTPQTHKQKMTKIQYIVTNVHTRTVIKCDILFMPHPHRTCNQINTLPDTERMAG